MSKKAFTLIELLAVIIILGVLLLVVVPSVTKYITNSKFDTYEKNLAKLVDTVMTDVNSSNVDYAFGANEYLVVPLTCIELEKGNNKKSPFGLYINEKSFVAVTRNYDKGGYNYYVNAIDVQGNGNALSSNNNIQVNKNVSSYSIKADNNGYIKTGLPSYKLEKPTNGGNTSFENDILNKSLKLYDCSNFNINVSSVDDIKVGDYIGYTPEIGNYSVVGGDNGTGTDEIQSATTDTNLVYRVFNITNDYIEIIPSTYDNNTLTMTGIGGFNNGVSILNDLCEKLYSNSKIGAVARSFNQDDADSKTTWDSLGHYGDYKGEHKIKVDPDTCVWREEYLYCNTGERQQGDYDNLDKAIEEGTLSQYYGTFGKKYPSIWQFDVIDDEKEVNEGLYSKIGRSSIAYTQVVDKNSNVYSYVLKKDGNILSPDMDRPNNSKYYYQNKPNEKLNGAVGFYIYNFIDTDIEDRNQIKKNDYLLAPIPGRFEINVGGKTDWYVVFDRRINTRDVKSGMVTCTGVYYDDLNKSSRYIDRCLKIVDGYDVIDKYSQELQDDEKGLQEFRKQVYLKIGAYYDAWMATRIYELDPDYQKDYLTIPVEFPHIAVINSEGNVQASCLYDSYKAKASEQGGSYKLTHHIMPIIKIPVDNVTFSKVGTDNFGYSFFKI